MVETKIENCSGKDVTYMLSNFKIDKKMAKENEDEEIVTSPAKAKPDKEKDKKKEKEKEPAGSKKWLVLIAVISVLTSLIFYFWGRWKSRQGFDLHFNAPETQLREPENLKGRIHEL